MQLGKMMQTKDVEIKRLQELCEKNKIEYKPKTQATTEQPKTQVTADQPGKKN